MLMCARVCSCLLVYARVCYLLFAQTRRVLFPSPLTRNLCLYEYACMLVRARKF